ncbi:MAG: shikimate kinase [Bacteroidales bacterium]|nr:shikimate kinase [Bacteroidales bacterium]
MRVFLVGYMYSGKSTLGRRLAAAMGYRFVDIDDAFEERYRVNIPLFFKKYDETAFRTLEAALLRDVAAADDIVISTGGGTPCYNANMDFMLANGRVVFLDMPAPAILSRMATSKKPRPLLQDKHGDELRNYVTQQLAERMPTYQRAHITVSAINANATAIAALLAN